MENMKIVSYWDSRKIIYQAEAESFAALLQAAIKVCADLSSANLCSADLSSANLSSANLHGADLRGADLCSAENAELALAQTSIVPEHGSFIGWKLCQDSVLVQVQIPVDAKRSNATGRKCRAEYVTVLDVIGATKGVSKHDSKTTYVKGEVVRCDNWNTDRFTECGGGIHFFLTRIEAENYD